MTRAETVHSFITDCLCKQDVPEVDAAIVVVQSVAEAHWRGAVQAAVAELEAGLDRLEDDLPTPEVDALSREDEQRRSLLLSSLVASFLVTLRERASAPLSPARQQVVALAGRRLVQAGSAAQGVPLDRAAPLAQEALTAAERDLGLLMRGRVDQRVEDVRRHLELFLTNRAARTPAPASPPSALPGAVTSRDSWREQLQTLLGARTNTWLPQTVETWAFRWYNVGGFLGLTQGGTSVALVAVNNPPIGPDTHTTPFCDYVHGRTISVSRARLQLGRYISAVRDSNIDGMISAWPLLDNKAATKGGPSAFRVRFASLGLPPYHWECRTVVMSSLRAPR